jgi:hypothetical protein
MQSERRGKSGTTVTPRGHLGARPWAAVVCVVPAAAVGLPSIPIGIFVLRERRLPWMWDLFPMMGGPWWDSMSIPQFIASLGAFLAVNLVVAVGGIMLWRGRRMGAVLALGPLPLELLFWLGYALPIPPLTALLRIALVAAAWHDLRAGYEAGSPT